MRIARRIDELPACWALFEARRLTEDAMVRIACRVPAAARRGSSALTSGAPSPHHSANASTPLVRLERATRGHGQVRPNQRWMRLVPNSALATVRASDGPSYSPTGGWPGAKVTSTRAT